MPQAPANVLNIKTRFVSASRVKISIWNCDSAQFQSLESHQGLTHTGGAKMDLVATSLLLANERITQYASNE